MGRPANHYRDSAGREIHGLGKLPDKVVKRDGEKVVIQGRFYAIRARSKTFGRDPIQAVRKFRQWEQEGAKVSLTERHKSADGIGPNLVALDKLATGEVQNIHDINSDAPYSIHDIPQNLIWEYVGAELDKRPKWVAEQVGREELGYLDDLEPPAPSLKLEEIPKIFAGKKKTSDQEKCFAKASWQEFVKIMRKVDQVKTLRDIKQEHVQFYHDWIHEQIDKGKYGPKYANKKMAKIRTVLRYALKKASDKTQLRRVIDITELFESARLTNGKAKAITIEDYHKLLKASKETDGIESELWTALLHFSLNICATGMDFECCEHHHIDLIKSTVVYPRPKTGIMRVGVLWERTTAAIAAYQTKHPHGLDVVFANWDSRKKRYSRMNAKTTINRQFRKIADKAGLPKSVTITSIRKGGYSAALEGKCDSAHCAILMGHALPLGNVSDDYLERNPQHVADACTAIEDHFFGGKKGR